MPKRSTKKKPQPDHQQLARKLLDTVVPDGDIAVQADTGQNKNPAAVALGKLGGKKGGPARAKKLSKARRSEIAKKAAATRWKAGRKSRTSKEI